MLSYHQRHIRLHLEISQKIFAIIVTTVESPTLTWDWKQCIHVKHRRMSAGLRALHPKTAYSVVDFFLGWTALVGQGLLIAKVSRSHSLDTPQSVGLLWMRIGPSQRTLPDNTQHSKETDIHIPGGNRTHNPSKRTALYSRLRPCGHQDRLYSSLFRVFEEENIFSMWLSMLVRRYDGYYGDKNASRCHY
jgi:hypothetical protein